MQIRQILEQFDDPNVTPGESRQSRAQRLRVLADRLALQHVEMKARAHAAVQDARDCRRAALEAHAWFEELVLDRQNHPAAACRRLPAPPPPQSPDEPMSDENALDVILRRLRGGDHDLAHQLLGPEGRDITQRLYEMPEVEEQWRPRRVALQRAARVVHVTRGGVGALRERLVREARAALRRPSDEAGWRRTRPDTP